jgi:hypothetical protein
VSLASALVEVVDPEVDPSTIPGLKFATPRDESFPTIGHRQARWASVWLGRNLMPWQRLVLNVAGEYDPATGLPRYRTCVDTVQRQAGKSDLAMVGTGERSFSIAGFRSWYTAQTGQDARIEFLKFHDDTLDGTALSRVVRLMRGRGEEILRYPNGSEMRPHPPSEAKLHGKQSDRNDIDEAWAFDLESGRLLMQAIAPTQLTRPGAQTWIHSAGGTANSTWLADWVARGRRDDRSFAYFEFGIPDDLDASDIEAVAAYHPAVGHTITVDALRSLAEKLPDLAGFARAAGNRWTEIVGGAIGAADWEAVRYADPLPGTGRLGFGAARAEDGSHVVIATAEQITPDLAVAEVVDVLATAVGAAEHVIGWAAGDPIVVDPSGPSANLAADLSRLRAPNFTAQTGRAAAASCTDFLDAIRPSVRAYRLRQHPALDAAAKVAATRPHGDGGRVWSRTSSSTSIAAIEAADKAFAALKSGPVGVPMIAS